MATDNAIAEASQKYEQHNRVTGPLHFPSPFTVMTDLDRFVELYRSVGVESHLTQVDLLFPCQRTADDDWLTSIRATQRISIATATKHGLAIYFDEHGKFVGQGIWE